MMTTMVPVRGVFEHLGAQVSWDATTREAIITRGDRQIVLRQASAQATVDGKSVRFAACNGNPPRKDVCAAALRRRKPGDRAGLAAGVAHGDADDTGDRPALTFLNKGRLCA